MSSNILRKICLENDSRLLGLQRTGRLKLSKRDSRDWRTNLNNATISLKGTLYLTPNFSTILMEATAWTNSKQ